MTEATEIRLALASSDRLGTSLSPQPILEAVYGFALSRTLSTAVELDLFTRIAEGGTTLEGLHRETGCSRVGLSRLLNTLTAMNLVERSAESYELPAISAAYLVRSSPQYLGGYVSAITNNSWAAWAQLSDVVRSGRPAIQVHGDEPDSVFFSELVPALHALSTDAARVAARAMEQRGPGITRKILDVAAGSAVWSLAMAAEDPRAQVTVIDLPEVLDRVTRKFVEREGYSDRFTFRPGNLRQTDFGEGTFDVVILGHVCHGEGAEWSRYLIQSAYRALRPSGHILIADLLPDDDRRGPLFPLLFGLYMLVITDKGGTFTFAEYREWLAEAGFTDVSMLPVPAPSPLVIATKRERYD